MNPSDAESPVYAVDEWIHRHMLALTVVYYNYCRKHKSLNGMTPAMAAGLTDYRWTASDLLALDMWTPAVTKAA